MTLERLEKLAEVVKALIGMPRIGRAPAAPEPLKTPVVKQPEFTPQLPKQPGATPPPREMFKGWRPPGHGPEIRRERRGKDRTYRSMRRSPPMAQVCRIGSDREIELASRPPEVLTVEIILG